jgi:hypothetical protein
MTNEQPEPKGRRLSGCGVAVMLTLAAFAVALLYILFNFGAWLGDL